MDLKNPYFRYSCGGTIVQAPVQPASAQDSMYWCADLVDVQQQQPVQQVQQVVQLQQQIQQEPMPIFADSI